MNITLKGGPRHGEVRVPSSKSFAHRQLICAVLAGDPSPETTLEIRGISDDLKATIECMKVIAAAGYGQVGAADANSGQMGAADANSGQGDASDYGWGDEAGCCRGDAVGCSQNDTATSGQRTSAGNAPAVLDPGESGSTLRFLLPVVGALGIDAVFTPGKSLASRPVSELTDLLMAHGMKIETNFPGNSDKPVRISCSGKLSPGYYVIPGNISSQYVTGLLLALPLLDGDSTLSVTGPVESLPYISITEEVLKNYGINIEKHTAAGTQTGIPASGAAATQLFYRIPGNQVYTAPAFGIYDGTPAAKGTRPNESGPVADFASSVEGDWAAALASHVEGDLSAAPVSPVEGNRTAASASHVEGDRAAAPASHVDGVRAAAPTSPVEGDRSAAPASLVEGDWSAAAPFLCIGALSEKGVTVHGLSPESVQGDRKILEILREYGADILIGENSITVSAKAGDPRITNALLSRHAKPAHSGALGNTVYSGSSPSTHIIDASDIPDLVPVLAAFASVRPGRTEIINAGRLRLKESDRLKTTAAMLEGLGAEICETEDGLIINGKSKLAGGPAPASGRQQPDSSSTASSRQQSGDSSTASGRQQSDSGSTASGRQQSGDTPASCNNAPQQIPIVPAYNDHRIAMAAAVAATVCSGEITIEGAGCVAKSYSDFFEDFNNLEVEE